MELEAENVKPIRRYDKEGFIYNSNDGTTLHIGMDRDDNDYEELRWHLFLELLNHTSNLRWMMETVANYEKLFVIF